MSKEEFINKFSDKDKIEIAETYLATMYDQLMRNDYYQKVAISEIATQALQNEMANITQLPFEKLALIH